MKDIERELALHPGSVYAAFGSKRALFEAALERYGDAMQRDGRDIGLRRNAKKSGRA